MRSRSPDADRVNQGGALDQFISRRRYQQTLGFGSHPMPRPSHTLQRHRNRPCGANLNHQIHRSDIDTKFERSRSDHSAQFASLQPRFGIEPERSRKATVMRQYNIVAEPLCQRVRDTL